MTLIDDIDQIIAAMKKRQAELLAKRLTGAFIAGFKTAPGKPIVSEVQKNAIRLLATDQMGYISEFDSALGEQLKDRVKGLMAEGKGYEDVRKEMMPYIKETFGDSGTVTIDRIGQTRQIIEVGPDGSLTRVEKPITQAYSTNTKAYSEMLSRTSMHAATTKGRAEGYKAAGVERWQYVAVPDERVRPDHIALTGQVFEVGTIEEEMALEKLSEPNCRCRQVPFFSDTDLDEPQSTYDQQKENAGLYWDDAANEWAFKDAPRL
jgi:SPP1 gp7 family putative phage head morphogenesis protein